ncbi:Hpt domain-containing protein [Planctomicrobium sp. SH527]|uniref:Hpt domain-containing protein n=1 Tax=Planctomicrobium sp. SH527 TaxID=3448123 RepID=UPI003F5B03C9
MNGSDDRKAVIGIEQALDRVGNDLDLLKDIANFYLEDAITLLDGIDDALATGDSETIALNAHTLKGLSANFDAHSAVNAASEIEKLGRGLDFNGIQPKLDRLKIEVDRVVEALKADVLSQQD